MNLTNNRQKLSTWIFNPFLYLGGERIFAAGMIILAIHIPLGYMLDIRFDGAIDLHLVPSVSSWMTPVVDILIAWGSMVICMFVAARLFQSPIRLIDIAGGVALSRIPLLLSILPVYLLDPNVESVEQLLSLQGTELYQLAALGIISMIFLVWLFVLLFNAFKINSNLKGARLWTGFIGSIVIAEIVSLLLLNLM